MICAGREKEPGRSVRSLSLSNVNYLYIETAAQQPIKPDASIVFLSLLLREELANQTLFVFVFEASEKLRAERLDCLWTVER